MGFLGMLMQVIWVGVILSATMAAAAITLPIALPNCSDRCGDVKIPYPYGTTEGCYLNDDVIRGYYFINCTTNAYGQPQPMIGDFNVRSISIEEGEIEVQMDNSLDCYDKSGAPLEHNSVSLTLPSYTVSTKNKFVAVGCDTGAYLTGDLTGQISVGCMSKCQTINSVVNGTCSGIGCCKVGIPAGMKNVTFRASSFNKHKEVWKFNPCSFAFIVQEDRFNFSSGYLSSLRNNLTHPMVLDWTIGNEICIVAQNKSTYICGASTACSDLNNGSGYRCKCEDGYEGNPYLKVGCQDIDECGAKELNNCTSHQYCVNLPGSYYCSCIKGYHLDGEACVLGQFAPNKSSLAITLTIGIGVGLLVLLVGGTWIYLGPNKRKEKFFQQNGGLELRQKLPMEIAKIYSEKELKKATDNYNGSIVLGQGGYGTSYRGLLPDNRVVAIKKCEIGSQQVEQFINEITMLTQIHHRNVVKLLGCCLETKVPLLVYEFVPNGSLSDRIHDKSQPFLPWEMRLRIAAETAGALAYMHFATSVPIIHRVVKTANILLDENFTAKVFDFGAFRLIPHNQTELNTLEQGTFGYIDPEYFHTGQLTEKSDVYSFGVVLAELLTGRMAFSFNIPESDRNLAMYFVSAVKDDRLFQILEDHIVKEGNIELLKEVAKIAKSCLSVRGEDRPSMKAVAIELGGLVIMEKHPWENANVNIEENEHLLNSPTQSFNVDFGTNCSSNTTIGHDSMINQVLKPLDGRR